MSKGQYQTSRIIVWTSALMVLGMLCGLMLLFHRWVLYPVRLLQRGVRQGGPRLVRLQDRARHRRRDARPGRGLQRHDGQDQPDLRRPGAAGAGAKPAARPIGAAGRRRLPGGRRGARDQQSAGVDRLLLRGAREPAGQSPCRLGQSRSRRRFQLSEDDPGRSLPVQEHHREAARFLALQRHQARARPTWPA